MSTSTFLNYLDYSEYSLSDLLVLTLHDLKISGSEQLVLYAFLEPLAVKHMPTWEHSNRVALLCHSIARLMHIDEKAAFCAGLLHDIGKAQTPLATLEKTEGWTDADTRAMRCHVMDGYRLIRDRFDFSAEVILWHHRFQPKGYPVKIPKPLHPYSLDTKTMIAMFGRILSLADTFDALHRVNDKFKDEGALTGESIKKKMFQFNPGQKKLIEHLYAANIFTTDIFT